MRVGSFYAELLNVNDPSVDESGRESFPFPECWRTETLAEPVPGFVSKLPVRHDCLVQVGRLRGSQVGTDQQNQRTTARAQPHRLEQLKSTAAPLIWQRQARRPRP